jgi:hypothetical protein
LQAGVSLQKCLLAGSEEKPTTAKPIVGFSKIDIQSVPGGGSM